MTRTYVKGRMTYSNTRGFKRTSVSSHCRCGYCYNTRKKSWKKTIERNIVKSLMKEYHLLKSKI